MRFSSLTLLAIPVILSACAPIQNGQDNELEPSSSSSSSSHSSVSSFSSDTIPPFGLRSNGQFAGTVVVSGYPVIMTVDEPFCEQNCQRFDYVFFNLTSEPTIGLEMYFDQNEGNAYLTENMIGLGCRNEFGQLEYINDSESVGRQRYTLMTEESDTILTATQERPVTLRITKDPIKGGTEAPACYSHFTEVELLNSPTSSSASSNSSEASRMRMDPSV